MTTTPPAPSWQAPALTGDDVREAAAICTRTLAPFVERDWSVQAGDLEWSCRHTIDHVADALLYYATHLATGSRERRPSTRSGDPARTPNELLAVVESAAAILATVFAGAPPDRRAFHSWGVADPTGYLGMGCTEILIHTYDIAQGFGTPFAGPDEPAAKIIARIFPWAPVGVPAWEAFRWCTGRTALPGLPRQEGDWRWHCAPLSEWDGAIIKAPPPTR
jgi:hypothetical protein